jgi:hypothetical protein
VHSAAFNLSLILRAHWVRVLLSQAADRPAAALFLFRWLVEAGQRERRIWLRQSLSRFTLDVELNTAFLTSREAVSG